MKVIFAGYSKCGTKTMREAFALLGYENWDIQENYKYERERWLKIFKHGGGKEDFYQMYKEVDSVTDIPSFHFWEEILGAFPDAKIVFCQRDEDEWWASRRKMLMSRQSFKLRAMRMLSPSLRAMQDFLWLGHAVTEGWYAVEPWFGYGNMPEQLLRRAYRRHNRNVLENAPKDRLLVFDLKEGWEPLCRFLNVPVPDCPFPHNNKNATYVAEFFSNDPLGARIKREVKISCALIAASIALGAYRVHKYGLPDVGRLCGFFC